jgi:hypothetical protein
MMRSLTAALAVACAACAGSRAHLTEVQAKDAPDAPGVLELHANRGETNARIFPSGEISRRAAECLSTPCRAVLAPGRYRVLLSSVRAAWADPYSADVEVEVAACATERIEVSLDAGTGGERVGRIVRQDRLPIAADPGRVGAVPAACAAAEAPAPAPAEAQR